VCGGGGSGGELVYAINMMKARTVPIKRAEGPYSAGRGSGSE
jgi:hypothetical protein